MKITTINFLAKFENLRKVLDDIDDFFTSNVSKRIANFMHLVSEEALVNVIKYAYENVYGAVKVTCKIDEREVCTTVEDQGKKFDIVNFDNVEEGFKRLKELSPGGFGIMFIKNKCDSIEYFRCKNSNILIMKMFPTKK